MSVKTIFKTLIGTAVLIVASFMIIEIFNVSIVSSQLQNLTKVSAYQSCALFSQETYKTDTNIAGTVNMPDILAPDGSVYISGVFYNGSDKKDIWRNLYTNSVEFKDFCNKYDDTFTNLALLYSVVEKDGRVSVPEVSWDSPPSEIQDNINATRANNFYDNMYTAANLGIPYMDKQTIEKMFKWNLTQLFSNCDPDNIRTDERGITYVAYNGFRCYPQDAKITNIKYTVFDLSDTTIDIDTVAGQLKSYTGLTVNGQPGVAANQGIKPIVEKDLTDKIIKDNAAIMAVEIDYYIPIAYSGITPLQTLFSWVWDNEVEGLDGVANDIGDEQILDIEYNGATENNTVQIMKSEDYKAPDNSVPTTGKLVFTLVK